MSWQFSHISSISETFSGAHLSADAFLAQIFKRQSELRDRFNMSQDHRVLLLAQNSIAFFVDLLALFRIGSSVVPLDPGSSPIEIEQICEEAEINFIFCEDAIRELKREVTKKNTDEALILFTSGSTGRPKGIQISYSALKEKLAILSKHISEDERKRVLCALPTYFGHGLICNGLFALFYSEHLSIAKKFDLDLMLQFGEVLLRDKITFFSSVPSVWHLIFNFSTLPQNHFLKRVHCASAPLSFLHAQHIQQWLGEDVDLYNVFGATEMLGWFAATKIIKGKEVDCFQHFWSVETSSSLEGELLLRSRAMFSGYLKNEEEQKKVMLPDGRFRSGDLFNEGKYLGRLRLVINKNGIKIYPSEIDRVLMSSLLVKDCHTFGVPHDLSGENVAVILSLKEERGLEELKEHCRKHLSKNKFPDHFIVVPEVPRNLRGKVTPELLGPFLLGIKA